MANIKDLKKKIKSTKSTLKTTSAMKLVSAAKLAKAQDRILNLRPYANELETVVKTVSALTSNYRNEYLMEKESKQSLLLVISSDKGLCGGYNSGLAKAVRSFFKENDPKDFKLLFIGKKTRDLLKSEFNAGKTYTFEKAEPTFDETRKLAGELADQFKMGEVGRIFIAYNSFNSVISFTPTVKQVLPMGLAENDIENLKQAFPFDFKYEPSPESIMDTLVPEVYINTIYTGLLDAIAAEHGSRMSAMENATKNCKEMIRELTIRMNKLRQAAITTELIEVVSGAESLNA
ncbi:MAG: ATP synthase F1 subunit gamma [Bacteriovoracaceae bacterium]|nr:ATP synthase F1 subunit gamma [Bacteriovoracaceae bacterium]